MHKSVRETLASMDSRELSDWQVFDGLEPIGQWRDDFNFAQLLTLVANMVPSEGSAPAKPWQFMPFVFERDPALQAEVEMLKLRRASMLSEAANRGNNDRQSGDDPKR